jgi:hypothetical protein
VRQVSFSIFGIAVTTGSHRQIFQNLLIRTPIRKTTKSPSISAQTLSLMSSDIDKSPLSCCLRLSWRLRCDGSVLNQRGLCFGEALFIHFSEDLDNLCGIEIGMQACHLAPIPPLVFFFRLGAAQRLACCWCDHTTAVPIVAVVPMTLPARLTLLTHDNILIMREICYTGVAMPPSELPDDHSGQLPVIIPPSAITSLIDAYAATKLG